MKKILIMVLIFAMLSSYTAAQIPDIGPGGCVPVHPTTGAPCPECCPGGAVKPKPPVDKVKPPAPDDGAKPPAPDDEEKPDDGFKKPYGKAKPN